MKTGKSNKIIKRIPPDTSLDGVYSSFGSLSAGCTIRRNSD